MKSEYCTHVFIDLLANVSNWTFVSNWAFRVCTVWAKWDAEREITYGRPNESYENFENRFTASTTQSTGLLNLERSGGRPMAGGGG